MLTRDRARRRGRGGRGECVPYARYGETLESVTAEIEVRSLPAVRPRGAADAAAARRGAQRGRLRAVGPGGEAGGPAGLGAGGAARAGAAGDRLHPVAGHARARCARRRRATPHRPLLKIKLGTPDDMPRLEAVREGAPKAADHRRRQRGLDGGDLLPTSRRTCVRLGVELVEQPLPAGEDEALAEIERPLPVCADESCHDRASLPALRGQVRHGEHQARQDRRADRGAGAARCRARGRVTASWWAAWSGRRWRWRRRCWWRRARR